MRQGTARTKEHLLLSQTCESLASLIENRLKYLLLCSTGATASEGTIFRKTPLGTACYDSQWILYYMFVLMIYRHSFLTMKIFLFIFIPSISVNKHQLNLLILDNR